MIWNKVYCYCALLLTFKYATAYESKISEYSVYDEHESNSENQNLTYATNTLVRSGDASTDDSTRCCSKPSYVIGQQKVTWQIASVLCQQAGMDLANPSSEEEEKALEEKWAASERLQNSITGIWIGGKRCAPCYHVFVWEATGKPVVYSNYLPNQPDNTKKNENCLELRFEPGQGETGLGWNDLSCGTKLKYACQSRCCCSQNK